MKLIMKKIIFMIILLLLESCSSSDEMNLSDDKNNSIENSTEINTKETQTVVYPDDVYKMLDFDRRLILEIGQQDEWLCSIFNLAYARAILDNKKSDPYDYYDGDGTVWRLADYEDLALDNDLHTVLQIAYDEIDSGSPVLFFVGGEYGYTTSDNPTERISSDHYVLLIGYRMNADYDNLSPSDFYAADPSNGYCCSADSYMPWITLSDDAPELVSGEYALYGQIGSKKVKTCIAYKDTCTWDSDLSKPIYPAYYE